MGVDPYTRIRKNIDRCYMKIEEKSPFSASFTVLLVIVAVGFVLRLYNLNGESLYLDEIYSHERAKLGMRRISKIVTRPLYFFILNLWMKVFGHSVTALRMPAVIFGGLGTLMMYFMGVELFNEKVGLLGSLIFSLSEFHIWQSQEVRMYSLSPLLILLSFYFFVRLIKTKEIRYAFFYVIFSGMMLYTHQFSPFTLLTQNIFIITYIFQSSDSKRWDLFKGWIALQSILAIVFLPLVPLYLRDILGIHGGSGLSWMARPTLGTILIVFKEYSGHLLLFILLSALTFNAYFTRSLETSDENEDSGEEDEENVRDNPWKIWDGKKEIFSPEGSKLYLLSLWLLIPNLIPFTVSVVWEPCYGVPKYTIGASLAFFFLTALGIYKIRRDRIKVFAVILLILLSSLNLGAYYGTTDKPEWKEVASFVDQNAERNDLIIFSAGFTQLNFDYYSAREDLVKEPFPYGSRARMPRLRTENVEVNEDNIVELHNITEGRESFWLVLSRVRGDKDLIKSTLSQDYKISLEKHYVEIDVYLYVEKTSL